MSRVARGGRRALAFIAAYGMLALSQSAAMGQDVPYAAVRVLLTGAAEPARDVWLGGTRMAVGADPGRAAAYVLVPAGGHVVGVATATGDDDGESAGPSSMIGSVDVQGGTYATLVVPGANGSDADGRDAGTAPFLVEAPIAELPPAGHASLRLVHVAPELSALAVAVRPEDGTADPVPRAPEGDSNGSPYLAEADPMSGSAYHTVPAGAYRVLLVGEDGEAVLPEPIAVSLRAGALHTLFVSDGGSRPARVTVAVDATVAPGDERSGRGPASLRMLHASPDAPLVDVVVDGTSMHRDVAPGIATSYADLSGGRHLVEVYPHRLPTSLTLPGTSAGSGEASADDDGDAAADASGEGGPTGPAPAPRLDPVTTLVDVSDGEYTTLVLTGRYEPAGANEERGGLTVSVDPEDASVTVQGPDGEVVAAAPGSQLLDGLVPETYRVEVRKEGFRSARYEVDVRPDTTATLSVTLQRTPDPSEPGEGAVAGGDGQQEAGPDFVNAAASQPERRSLQVHVYTGSVPIAAPGTARVRFVHVAPSIPHLDIVASWSSAGEDADGDGSSAALASLERLAYPNASEYLEIDAGTVDIAFHVAGSDNRLRQLPSVRLRPGTSYTFFLVSRAPSLEFGVVPTIDAIAPQRSPAVGGGR